MSGERAQGAPEWVNLRDNQGDIQARYNPRLKRLVIQRRGVKTLHDLAVLEPLVDQETSGRATEPTQLP